MRQNEKMSGNGNDKGGEKDTKRKYIIIILIVAAVVIAALVGVVIYLASTRKTPQQTSSNTGSQTAIEQKRDVLITEDNVQEVIAQMKEDEYVPQGYYTVTQNYEWHFKDGKSESYDAHVENLPENTNDVYFDLFLADNDEEPIYKSPVIPLGAVLEHFKLDTELSAGTYDCIIEYNLCNEDQESLGTVSMTVKVIIEN